MSEITDPSKLKVTELRSELQARGLDTKGNKPVLIERLREALEADKEKEKEEDPESEENGTEKTEPKAEESHESSNDHKNTQGEDEAEQQEVAEPNLDQEDKEEKNVESPSEPPEEPERVKEADVDKKEPVEKDKDNYEEAPVEDVDGEEKMDQEDDMEDKSAVDLIKDDFFNGITEELQDLEEDDDVKDEAATLPPMKEEEGAASDVKQESVEDQEKEGDEDESWDHKRGRKRAGSPIKEEDEATAKKSRSDEVCIVATEEVAPTTDVVLDWYNSDLSLKINQETRLSACPHQDKSFAYMWHGARATYGFTKGRVCYELTLEKNIHVPHIEDTEEHPHVVRVGWSVDVSGFTLGEEPRSWGYGGTGKASTDLKFKDYGVQFKAGDVVGAYLDLDVEPVVMAFTVNGEHQGIAYEVRKAEIGDQPLFPHILTKNVRYHVNFGSREEPMAAQLEGYTYVGHVPLADRVQGSQGPTRREDCEIIMMVGLPACGKTTWVQKYVDENKHMKYNVLGTNELIDKMKVQGVRRKRNYAGRWDQLISSCTKGLNQLLWLSHSRLRNYIIDQTNVYPTAQKRKMKTFAGFKRRAVVICPTDDDLKLRTQKREKEEGKDVPDSAVLEMKANFKLPEVGELFDSVEYVELDKEAAEKLVAQYNKEGQDANPEKGSSIASRIGGVSNFSRRDNDRGNRGGYRGTRGSWDRERDRHGGYDRRDRNGSWNRNSRDFSSRLGPRDTRGGSGSGGYNRDHRGGYNSYSSRGGGGSFRDNRGAVGTRTGYGADADPYKYQNTSYGTSNWSQGATPYGQGYGYGAGYGMQGYGAATAQSYNQSYNWPQNQYGQQQAYYQQGYRADAAATAAAPAATSGYYSQQVGSWGTTAAAATPAAQPAQNAWGTPGYSQPQQTWGTQSYGGYGYKK